MLQENPNERLALADVIAHPWLSENPIATMEEVRINFRQRVEKINEQR